jgi:hypothetical protein
MNVGIMQPYFFPYIGYFQLINAVDKFVFYDNCQYIKGGWINRNRLLQCGGEDFYITVPLKKHSYTILISQVEIYNGVDWRRKILLSMRQDYKRAPFYGKIYPIIENLFSLSYDRISVLNAYTISAICKLLNINTQLISLEEVIGTAEEESHIDEFLYEPRIQRILSICRHEKADTYINAIGGQELYHKNVFAENGIKLQFIRTGEISYTQRSIKFFPNLSILDVLFNVGVDGTKRLLLEYTLEE